MPKTSPRKIHDGQNQQPFLSPVLAKLSFLYWPDGYWHGRLVYMTGMAGVGTGTGCRVVGYWVQGGGVLGHLVPGYWDTLHPVLGHPAPCTGSLAHCTGSLAHCTGSLASLHPVPGP